MQRKIENRKHLRDIPPRELTLNGGCSQVYPQSHPLETALHHALIHWPTQSLWSATQNERVLFFEAVQCTFCETAVQALTLDEQKVNSGPESLEDFVAASQVMLL